MVRRSSRAKQRRTTRLFPFIEGDGIGVDITPVMIKVIDAAVAKAYGGEKKIHWMEVYAGEKSTRVYGPDEWLPKGDLRCPARVFGVDQGAHDHPGRWRYPLAQRRPAPGARSLSVRAPGAIFSGVPSPLKRPELIDMVIFRENTEDIYAGIEWQSESDGAKKVIKFLTEEMGVKKIRFPGPRQSASSRYRRKAPSA